LKRKGGSGTPANEDDPTNGVFGDARRYWPLVLLVALAAVAAALFALSRREPSYRATATLLITPLPQYDDTFLGVSLVRDAGDPNRTAATVAALLDSDDAARHTARALGSGWTARSVQDAIDVKPVTDTNVVRVTAETGDRSWPKVLATTYVKSALQLRWQRIAGEIDRRVAELEALRKATGGTNDELDHELAVLQTVRGAGVDPTLSHRRTGRTEEADGIPSGLAVALALAGGLVVGFLAAAALGALRRQPRASESQVEDEPAVTPDVSTVR
jgi:uncharacterized protein involved in exopolysaccharide biosynthesis